MMMTFALGVFIGVLIGWNVLAQPDYVKDFIDRYILHKI